jgi:hypothetical protein
MKVGHQVKEIKPKSFIAEASFSEFALLFLKFVPETFIV